MPRVGGVAYEYRGLKELRQGLKDVDTKLPRELTKVHSEGAKKIASDGASRLSSRSRLAAIGAEAVRGKGTALTSKITLDGNDGRAGMVVLGAALGALRWPQFPAWVGNSWNVGDPDAPYGVGAAIDEGADEMLRNYDEALVRLTAAAFPD